MQLLSDPELTRLCWGDPAGPHLSVGTLYKRDVPPIRTLPEALDLLRSTRLYWHWEPARGQTTAIGMAENGAHFVAFACSRPERALAELRAIEAQEGGLPYQLVLPVVATIKSRAQESAAPHNYQHFAPDDLFSRPEPALAAQEVRQAAEHLLAAILSTADGVLEIQLSVVPDSAVNLALVWYAACSRLWEPDMLRRVGATDPAPFLPRNLFLQSMALAQARVAPCSSFTVAGQQLRCSAEGAPRSAWPQLIEFATGAIPPEAVRYLCAGRLPVGLPELPLARPPDQVPARLHALFRRAFESQSFADPPIASDLAAALCRALLADLAEQGESYVPLGGCQVRLPADTVLQAWGITELRVWLAPEGLWCALPAADRAPGVVFEWQPGRPLRRWVVSDAAAPALEVTLTALWRDLRLAGEAVVPAADRHPTPQARPSRPASARLTGRSLPRRQYYHLSGAREWGEPAERERIRLAAHAVAGHRRRLLPGARASAAARQRAAEYAFLVPEGYTFVRPHIAGLAGEEAGQAAPQELVVRARGLATVAAWLRA